MEIIDLSNIIFDKDIANLIGHDYAVRYSALPIRREGGHLWVALPQKGNISDTISDLSDLTGLFIVPQFANDEDIHFYINQIYGTETINTIASQFLVDEQLKMRNDTPDKTLLQSIQSAPAVRLLDSLIETGVLNRASDIHIEPFGQNLRTRYRVDGQLITHGHLDLPMLQNIISRLKIMSGMDIAEKRRPQDGHFSMTILGEEVEFRLSTLPTVYGEKAAIRLLYGQTARLKKEELGFFSEDLKQLTALFNKPYGAIFMTGPTGSGKSTTLNSFLEALNDPAKNVVTVEDPVENPILGVNHVHVERAAGLDFANALRHILRQDPDIIMIGEVRDEETARIAIQAAGTGHLVLSTLHTNDAAGVIERLIDMGIEPYLAASALTGVISQRLVRRICRECIIPVPLPKIEANLLSLPPNTTVYAGAGCNKCNNTGYKGRLAVYEYIIMNEKMRRKMSIETHTFAAELRKMNNLKKNAVRHLLEGSTTLDEVMRVVG